MSERQRVSNTPVAGLQAVDRRDAHEIGVESVKRSSSKIESGGMGRCTLERGGESASRLLPDR